MVANPTARRPWTLGRRLAVWEQTVAQAFGAGIPSPSRPRSGEAPRPGTSTAPWLRVRPRSLEKSRHAPAPACP